MSKVKYIANPSDLWKLFDEFRIAKKKDPIIVLDWVGKEGREVEKPHQRPLTMSGFSAWLHEEGIIANVWHYFNAKAEDEDNPYHAYFDICRVIKEVIRTDQIEGGMAGIYNSSITQRLNGLVDKQHIETKKEPRIFGKKRE